MPLRRKAGRAVLDLSRIRVFTGLSVVARMLGDEVLEQIQAGDSDVVVQRRIINDITPELAAIGLARILIYAREPVLRNLRDFQEEFHQQIRAVFGTIQRPRWGSVLFPELFSGENSSDRAQGSGGGPTQGPHETGQALLFPFHLHSDLEQIDYFFLVEREVQLQFLRITIEPVKHSRLDLGRIPHVTVTDLDRRTYIQGLTRAAETFRLGLLRECEERRTEHLETDRRHPEFFEQVRRAGLVDCEAIRFQWPARLSTIISDLPRPQAVDFLKRVLLSLEDRELTELLGGGNALEIQTESARAFLDTSRLGRTLNISFGESRREPDLESYLRRMPILAGLADERPEAFAGSDIVLVHHITSEILGVIRALERMGAHTVTVLFVRYAGVVPHEYLEVLLSRRAHPLHLYGLHKVESDVRGHYLLSEQFSPIADLPELQSELRRRQADFFEAMRLTAGHLFLRAAANAAREGRRILLVEDGGYLAPELHAACSGSHSLGDVADRYSVPAGILPAEARIRPLEEWLLPLMPGSVEHTRNGYDRLLQISQSEGSLRFPSLSIAVSKLKRGEEAAEVAVTVLHAVESILHGLGMVLSRRRTLVLGSCGAIGSRIMQALTARDHVAWGVDLAAQSNAGLPWDTKQVSRPHELPDEVLAQTDLIVGVVGHSILDETWLERWITGSRKPVLFLASGSTKTLEFSHLFEWLQAVEQGRTKPRGQSAQLQREPIRDPQTGLVLGTRIRFQLEEGWLPDLMLLGELTPINFLYYGVPTETMDGILTQLVQLAAVVQTKQDLAPGIYALDKEIDAEGRLLGRGESV